MNTYFIDRKHGAIIRLVHIVGRYAFSGTPIGDRPLDDYPGMTEKIYMVTEVYVPEENRGNGYASRLLKKMLKEADAEGVSIVLRVGYGFRDDDDYVYGLRAAELTQWYSRYGFQYTPDDVRGMYQIPKKPRVNP